MTRAKPYLGVPPEHFQQEGESQVYTRHDGRSGKAVENHFCGTCGAYVYLLAPAPLAGPSERVGRKTGSSTVKAEMAGSCTPSTRLVQIAMSMQVRPHPPYMEDSPY